MKRILNCLLKFVIDLWWIVSIWIFSWSTIATVWGLVIGDVDSASIFFCIALFTGFLLYLYVKYWG